MKLLVLWSISARMVGVRRGKEGKGRTNRRARRAREEEGKGMPACGRPGWISLKDV